MSWIRKSETKSRSATWCLLKNSSFLIWNASTILTHCAIHTHKNVVHFSGSALHTIYCTQYSRRWEARERMDVTQLHAVRIETAPFTFDSVRIMRPRSRLRILLRIIRLFIAFHTSTKTNNNDGCDVLQHSRSFYIEIGRWQTEDRRRSHSDVPTGCEIHDNPIFSGMGRCSIKQYVVHLKTAHQIIHVEYNIENSIILYVYN